MKRNCNQRIFNMTPVPGPSLGCGYYATRPARHAASRSVPGGKELRKQGGERFGENVKMADSLRCAERMSGCSSHPLSGAPTLTLVESGEWSPGR
ncbi:hypothetical protein O3P69_003977 [Scylla paramamosain]|uniref:Uncharacterized protein n=1 Tax=Scylla paramamosain TaxID=85552 RepID=A0AAW0UGA3_SCYPA